MITEVFIRRPIFTIVISLVILLAGLLAYLNLSVRLYPKVNTAVITVYVSYPGADAALMEGAVTTPIENALGSVEGLDYITSASRQGYCYASLHLKLDYDINTALNEVNAKLAAVRDELPIEVHDPQIMKEDPDARPIMFLNFASNTLATIKIANYLYRVVQPQLQTISGVSTVNIFSSDYAMRIWLNPYLMAAHDVTPWDIENVFSKNNLQIPGGQLENSSQLINVKTISDLNTAAQFNNIILKSENGNLVRLNDIGKTELGAQNNTIITYVNGKPSVPVGIIPASNANYLFVAKDVKLLLSRLVKNLPTGISASIFWDNTKFIYASIKEIKIAIFEAAICVILVIFMFIGSWRILLIPVMSIPLSLIGICAVMYLMNYSLNTMTFLAFVLAIGMVVDDAIVVSENIHRHIVSGKDPMNAAILGSKEIQFAIIAMTLTLAAVYIPIAFLHGLIGALFKEFAFTLAGAVIISGFVALTLLPMMCSKIMTKNDVNNYLPAKINQFSERIISFYENMLIKILYMRRLVIFILPIIIVGCILFYHFIPRELAPKEDTGTIVTFAYTPTSANINYTAKYTKLLEPIFKKVPEVENYVIVNGDGGNANTAFALLDFKPWSKRKRTSDEIIKSMSSVMMAIPEIIAQPTNPSEIPGASSWKGSVNIELQTTGNYLELNNILQKFLRAAHDNKFLVNLNTNLKLDQRQDNILIDRIKAADMGISIKDIGYAVNLAMGQPTVSHFNMFGRNYDIVPQLLPQFRKSDVAINSLQLRTNGGNLVPLSNLIKIQKTISPQSLNHFQQLRSASITAGLAPGYTLGEALKFFQKLSKKILPQDMQINYSGESRLYFQSSSQIHILFIFSVLVIFLVLAAQFESFRNPFIVLLAVPFSLFGALLIMFLTGCTLNIYSEIGIITLVGLISKHGILMVEFANQLQFKGKDVKGAIITAALIRLRPILMTTAAMVLGAIPLVFANGAGANSRRQIGLVIVGGMLIGTFFTIFMLPTMYTYLAKCRFGSREIL
ncbi:MAG: efflux RND transporter permease subunit [Gammaproteobacteria bacterium]|jgi:multidrug efflux pump